MGEAFAVQAATGLGAGAGVGVGIWAALRFIRWLAEFVAARHDNRSDRLDKQERDLEDRFNARLRHVEQDLDRYREATMLLVNALAERDPQNKALSDVARILRTTVPISPADPDLDELILRARRKGEK